MIQCPNCGYENNPDDALSCNLCGKVFRKEVRENEHKDKPKESMKEKLYKFYQSMKVEEKPFDEVRWIGTVVKGLRQESDWRGRIILIIFILSFVLGYIETDYFYKVKDWTSYGADPLWMSIFIVMSILTLIILIGIYLILEMIFKIIMKIFTFIRR